MKSLYYIFITNIIYDRGKRLIRYFNGINIFGIIYIQRNVLVRIIRVQYSGADVQGLGGLNSVT